MTAKGATAGGSAAEPTAEVQRGRELYEKRAWREAHEALSRADEVAPLGGDDLFRLAMCHGLFGQDDRMLEYLERAHAAYRDGGELQRAARMAIWLGFRLSYLGEQGRANGWWARAARLVEAFGRECAELGYLLIPELRRHLAARDDKAAHDVAAQAAAIGERFADPDLVTFARNIQGQALMRGGQVEKGLALLDEAMVAVTARETSPIFTGLIYCNVIQGCQQVYALGRSREWTAALQEWCADVPEISFAARCLVHRSEILQLDGAWQDAIDETVRASERAAVKATPALAAMVAYQEGELRRLRGEEAKAEEAYRRVSQFGSEPQPGLALLRLAQGRIGAASSQIRRVAGSAGDRLQRIRFLPAYVEILLAAGDVAEAERACGEIEETAAAFGTPVLGAMADHARGAVMLGQGNAQGALGPLRRSLATWQTTGAPYIAARLRVLVARACRALGDAEAADVELDAARDVFREVGASPDLARLRDLGADAPPGRPHGLTKREVQVLLLVASGRTNKAIAAELFLSDKTIDRHLSNIFGKLGVSSRAAATAFAYSHKLL